MNLIMRKHQSLSPDQEQCIRFNAELLYCFPELTIVKLRRESKQPTTRFDLAREKCQKWGLNAKVMIQGRWITQGDGVGLILLRSPLWVLDLDAVSGYPTIVDETIQRLRPPQVLTPSGGKHCYFRLPEDLIEHPHLKAHVCHPTVDDVVLPLDLKLGGRQTLVVAAGTTRGSRRYRPLDPWGMPPILDPRDLFPEVEILHSHQGQEFDVDPRPLEARIVRAQMYLRKAAPICISKKRARCTLSRVCSHLVRFLRLPEPLALKLMTTPSGKSWNVRCRNGETGEPWPWTPEELLDALRAARNAVPAYGVIARQIRLRDEARDSKLRSACTVIAQYASQDGSPVAVTEVYKAVMEATGMPHDTCTLDRFGKYLGHVGVSRCRKGHKRIQSLMLSISSSQLEDCIREVVVAQGVATGR